MERCALSVCVTVSAEIIEIPYGACTSMHEHMMHLRVLVVAALA